MDPSDETEKILERARQRELELGKENCSYTSEFIEIVKQVEVKDEIGTQKKVTERSVAEVSSTTTFCAKAPSTATAPSVATAPSTTTAPSTAIRSRLVTTEIMKSPLKGPRTENLNIDAPRVAQRRSRFAELSANVANFECEMKHLRPKEAPKGAPARLSMGETRPSALFVPTTNYYPQATTTAPVRSAAEELGVVRGEANGLRKQTVGKDGDGKPDTEDHKAVEKKEKETTTVVDGGKENGKADGNEEESKDKGMKEEIQANVESGDRRGGSMKGLTTVNVSSSSECHKTLSFASPICEVNVFSSCSTSTAESSINSPSERIAEEGGDSVCSPKSGTDNSDNSPNFSVRESEQFGIHNFFTHTTKSTEPSSDDVFASTQESSPVFKSPKRTVDFASKVAPGNNEEPKKGVSTRTDIVDDLMVVAKRATEGLESPAGRAREIAHRLEAKIKQDGVSGTPKPKPRLDAPGKSSATKPSYLNTPVHIHFRSNVFTSVPPVPAAPIGPLKPETTTPSSVKNLRSRWEVSSTTGTPLHPDQEEDDLLRAARLMVRDKNQAASWKARPRSCIDSVDDSDSKHSPRFSPLRSVRPLSKSTSVFRSSSAERVSSKVDDEEKEKEKEESGTMKMYPTIDGDAIRSLEKEVIAEAAASGDDSHISHNKSNSEAVGDEFIDEVFQFIDETPNRNSSLVSGLLSTPDASVLTVNSPTKEETDSYEEHVPLVHSVSFYRSMRAQKFKGEAIVLGQFETSPPHGSTSSESTMSAGSGISEGERFQREKARLEEAIGVQQEQIAQASRALSFCRSTQEFRGSREEVDAQRALLIATERRRALILVLDSLLQARATGYHRRSPDGPLGTLTISHITVKLMRDFVNGHINYQDEQMLFYFIVLIRYGETVLNTTMVTSDEGMKTGKLEFPHYLQLHSLPHDFSCILEVYSLRTRREVISHAEKYRIKGNPKKPQRTAMFSPGFTSPGGPSVVIDPSFQKVGFLNLNIASVSKNTFQLTETLSPLDGAVQMKLRCFAEETGTIGHKGFLSLYQEVEKIGSWTRFWCALCEGQLRFWRYPEDENSKPVVCLDLRTSACAEVKPLPMGSCPFPNSMKIDVFLPADQQGKRDKIRVLMAADTKEDMRVWLNALNGSLRNLTLWNRQ